MNCSSIICKYNSCFLVFTLTVSSCEVVGSIPQTQLFFFGMQNQELDLWIYSHNIPAQSGLFDLILDFLDQHDLFEE